MKTIATDILLVANTKTCDSMRVTWNLSNGEEVEVENVLFWNMDDFQNGLAYALVESGVEWADVTSYVVVVVKDVEWNKEMYESENRSSAN